MQFTLHTVAVAGGLALAAILSSDALIGQSAPAQTGKPYAVPRTPWGDPDLQGKWPSTDLVGVQMQRDPKLGTRNVLTEEEFTQRQEQFARQAAQDEAEFDLEQATSTPGGDVGGPVSPPPHWLERGKPQYQASLIVDPADGRMPPFTAEAQARQQAQRDAQAVRRKELNGREADSYLDRSLYHRCVTRGIAGSILPVIYNYPLKLDDDYGFYEHACHEGNYSMFNILSGARAQEKAVVK